MRLSDVSVRDGGDVREIDRDVGGITEIYSEVLHSHVPIYSLSCAPLMCPSRPSHWLDPLHLKPNLTLAMTLTRNQCLNLAPSPKPRPMTSLKPKPNQICRNNEAVYQHIPQPHHHLQLAPTLAQPYAQLQDQPQPTLELESFNTIPSGLPLPWPWTPLTPSTSPQASDSLHPLFRFFERMDLEGLRRLCVYTKT